MILIADDQFNSLDTLKKVLEAKGIEMELASSGGEALRKILKNDYELIILDIKLPGINVFDIADKIKELSKVDGLPIMLSSSVDISKSHFDKGLNKGVWDYFKKPIEIDLLVYKICHAISRYRETLAFKAEKQSLQKEIGKLKQADSTKEEFISIAAHELSTPITSINGHLQLALRAAQKNGIEQTIHLLNKGLNQVNKLNRLAKDLLDSSRLQAGKMVYNFSVFNCAEFLKQTIENVKYTYPERKISCVSDIEVLIEGDQERLEQVLTNYLTNALKYSPVTSEVIVYTKMKEGRQLSIHVKDFGPGISPEMQHHIFQKYYRVKDSKNTHQGLGMGLFICSQIIGYHQGEFGLESEIGKGSIFYFSLPIKTKKEGLRASVKSSIKKNQSSPSR